MKKILLNSLLLISTCALKTHASDLSIFADGLYWNASEQTTSIWSSRVTSTTTSGPHDTSFSPTNINFNWHSGFRGGLMYESDQRTWNTKLTWTYFPAQAKTDKRLSLQILTPEFFSGFVSGNFFFGADINWQMKMNSVDLDISHPIHVTDHLTVNPDIGIKASTIDQSIDSSWDAVLYVANEYVDHDYTGIGPKLGINVDYELPYHLSLVGGLTSAFMWGKWNIRDQYIRPSALGVTATTITTTMNQSQLGTLMLDSQLGMQWTHKGKSEVAVKLMYEMQYWANQVRIPTFQILPVNGDLTIQGVTCGIYINL